MRAYSFLIKPSSSLCNMRCKYCFYEDESEHRIMKSMGMMTLETANSIITRVFETAKKNDVITFAFQGGEPTLVGKDFFKKFIELVKENNKHNIYIHYAIQTNGLLIDDEWINLFKENKFLVGISIDGDKNTHDLHRIDADKKGTWSKVTKAVTNLLNAGVDVNVLCVVTKLCARSPQKVYNSIKKLGIKHIQMIACLDPLEQERGNMPYSLLPNDYGKFLCKLFDIWYNDWKTNNYISIRLFEDFVHLALGMPPTTCATSGCCGSYYVIESDGSVYPCDFYALDEWKMGNINTNTLYELSQSPQAIKFLNNGSKKPNNCTNCRWCNICNGGCKRDWIKNDNIFNNYFCESFKMFFEYSESRIIEIANSCRKTNL